MRDVALSDFFFSHHDLVYYERARESFLFLFYWPSDEWRVRGGCPGWLGLLCVVGRGLASSEMA